VREDEEKMLSESSAEKMEEGSEAVADNEEPMQTAEEGSAAMAEEENKAGTEWQVDFIKDQYFPLTIQCCRWFKLIRGCVGNIDER